MDPLRRAKASRRALLAHLQRTLAAVKETTSSTDNATKNALRERLLSSKKKLEDVGSAIIELLDQEDEIEFEILEQEHSVDAIIEAVARLDALRAEDSNPPSEVASGVFSVGLEGLPRISLPTFDGDYLQWHPFLDQFNATVHNRSIPDVQKFTYLLSALRGDAREAVRGIPCTSENYASAMKILKDRFGDASLLISLYADRLVNMCAVKSNDTSSFRNLITNFESYLREITQLINEVMTSTVDSTTTPVHGLLLAPLLTGKLPRASQLEWARRAKSPKEKFDLDGLLIFAKSEIEALETLSTTDSASAIKISRNPTPRSNTRPHAAVSSLKVTPITACRLCDSDSSHSPFKCQPFLHLDPGQRGELVRKRSLCFNCLGNHLKKNCCSETRCRQCDRQHHTLLHRDSDQAQAPDRPATSASGDSAPVSATSVNCVTPDCHSKTLSILQTARVRVRGLQRTVRILLDTGAEESYVTTDLVREISPQLELIDSRFRQFETFGGHRSAPVQCETYRVYLSGLNSSNWVSAKLTAVPTICRPTRLLPKDKLKAISHRYPQITLADDASEALAIDILLGMDAIPQILLPEQRSLRFKRLSLTPSIFGYVVGGSIASTCPHESLVKSLRTYCLDDVSTLWELEGIGVESPSHQMAKPVSPRFDGDRYVVALPWIDSTRPRMTASQAHQRNSHFKRLSEEKRASYSETLETYTKAGILEPTTEDGGNFIPHHAVYQKGKQRIVYDASAKPWDGPSLNDCLQPGPNLLSDLTAILLRFRCYRFPLVADVEKAFLMISVAPDDRDYLKIVWFDKMNCKRISRFTRVPFGLSCGPYILLEVLRTHLTGLPDSSDLDLRLRDDLYMDDLVSGHNTLPSVTQLKEFAQAKFAEAGMNLREFLSTPEAMMAWTCEPPPNSRKVLGLNWCPAADCLSISLSIFPASTRRQVASAVAQLFDPLGLVSPWTIRLRMFLQRLWKSCDGWDGPLSSEDQREYDSMREESIDHVIYLPRHTPVNSDSELHVYADASQKAYAAVVYLKTKNDVFLLCSRARVAPLKPVLSLPRLELMAALLAVRLLRFVKESFSLVSLHAQLYSDSMIVLGWIRKPPVDVFVRNRVKEILSTTSPDVWSHIPGEINPADMPSRGVSASCLPTLNFWFQGPPSLQNYPCVISTVATSIGPTAHSTHAHEAIFPLHRYGSLRKAIRIAAWVLRFVANTSSDKKLSGDLSAEEEDKGMITLLIDCQKSCGPGDYAALKGGADVSTQSTIYDGRPEMDRERNIIICNPRNGEPPLPWLPIPSDLAGLVARDRHHQLYHMGVSSTTYEIRLSFWTRRCRQFVKKILSRCVKCKRMQSRKLEAPEGELPSFRTQASRPFERSGLDHFGPLYLRNKAKVWILVFTCSVTRAIHLEVVPSLDVTETALAVRRFFARRGQSSLFISDNGRSFVALSKLLRGKVKWNLISPSAPWWGGFWERLIGTIKRSCLKTLGNASLTNSELLTTLTELENVVNRRPIVASEDTGSLTPSHFLFGLNPPPVNRLISSSPHQESTHMCESTTESLRKLQRHRQMVSVHLWNRWRTEYLTSLRSWRRPRGKSQPQIRVDDIVIISPPDGVRSSRHKWSLGRVSRLIVGRDGCVRSCELKTANSCIRRPLQKLYPLECASAAK